MRLTWPNLSLAFRNILRQRRRSAIALAAISFSVIALVLVSGFIEWIFWAMREATIKTQLGHIQIVRPGYHDAGKADPYAFLLPDTIPELEPPDKDRIKAVAPRLSFGGLISHGDATLSFIGDGVDPHEQAAFELNAQLSAGRNLSADDPNGIVVGKGLARNLGVGIGDKVVLLTNTVTGGVNAIEVTVRGLFTTATKAYDDAALRLPIQTARQLLRTKGSHAWVVLLNDTAQTDTVLEELRNKLGGENLEVIPWYALADFYNKTKVLFTKQIQGIKVIIVLIILLSISNTMTMSVMERIGEIGTAMALGVRRAGITRLFLTEGILLGCAGGLLGLAIGAPLAALISSIGIPMPPPPGMDSGYTGEILLTWNITIEAVALAACTTLVASILPAWKASRMQIVDALRHNR
ncbi:MAG: ABC transporter permease [Nitrosospira sp. 56-18]|jgi:putative ABC transport system permease protein|nr:ABC transporter permease [Nitrosospira sp.]OJY13710.1 MAG: ABC transporter permease [Nitrosospira sp. 56-18]